MRDAEVLALISNNIKTLATAKMHRLDTKDGFSCLGAHHDRHELVGTPSEGRAGYIIIIKLYHVRTLVEAEITSWVIEPGRWRRAQAAAAELGRSPLSAAALV